MLRNNENGFGSLAKGFHWVIGLGIIGLLGLGLYMTSLEFNASVIKLYFWHKSVGIVILSLAVLRLGWRFANIRPRALPNHKKWEKALAAFIHFCLYGAMFGMPMTGWVMSSTKNYDVSVFGWFTLPDIVPGEENKGIASLAATAHEWMAYALIGAILLHAGGALKHHIIDRDDTLRRMLPGFIVKFLPAPKG